jgi:hypothetical protein
MTAKDLLATYRREVREDCDATLATARIQAWIDRHGIRAVAAATAAFIASRPAPPMSAHWFFSDYVFPAYVGR